MFQDPDILRRRHRIVIFIGGTVEGLQCLMQTICMIRVVRDPSAVKIVLFLDRHGFAVGKGMQRFSSAENRG